MELQEKLSSLTSLELDKSICLEIRARALALLIQWTLVDINNRFLGDHQVSANSMPACKYIAKVGFGCKPSVFSAWYITFLAVKTSSPGSALRPLLLSAIPGSSQAVP